MEGILRRFQSIGIAKGQEDLEQQDKQQEREKILAEIKKVSGQIARIESCFQMTSDEDLIDSCIYEMESLNARYRYLLRKAREEGVSREPFPAAARQGVLGMAAKT